MGAYRRTDGRMEFYVSTHKISLSIHYQAQWHVYTHRRAKKKVKWMNFAKLMCAKFSLCLWKRDMSKPFRFVEFNISFASVHFQVFVFLFFSLTKFSLIFFLFRLLPLVRIYLTLMSISIAITFVRFRELHSIFKRRRNLRIFQFNVKL